MDNIPLSEQDAEYCEIKRRFITQGWAGVNKPGDKVFNCYYHFFNNLLLIHISNADHSILF